MVVDKNRRNENCAGSFRAIIEGTTTARRIQDTEKAKTVGEIARRVRAIKEKDKNTRIEKKVWERKSKSGSRKRFIFEVSDKYNLFCFLLRAMAWAVHDSLTIFFTFSSLSKVYRELPKERCIEVDSLHLIEYLYWASASILHVIKPFMSVLLTNLVPTLFYKHLKWYWWRSWDMMLFSDKSVAFCTEDCCPLREVQQSAYVTFHWLK